MIDDFNDFAKQITGFVPYQYQVQVAKALLSGQNIILSVSTGAGKTWASLLPFLYAREKSLSDFPQKMIYSLPLRTLTNSIFGDVTKVLTESGFENLGSIQTGEYDSDKYFENDMIFSTIDQTLSNFLCFPLSLSKRQANINAGSLIGSYLVFDEFHLLEPKLSMATTLGMLRILGNLCRFCIMTATLSKDYIAELKVALNAEVISLDDFPEDTLRIKSLKIPIGKNCKKTVNVVDTTINAYDIIKTHKRKTIVICNRVEKAQQIYNDVVSLISSKKDKPNVICLHSRFFDEDRKEKEIKLKELFGKDNSSSAILISTQVIEAGMDISCDTMHVEISPINSFLQRAGRCARWEDEFGVIYVYDILDLEEHDKIQIDTEDEDIKKQIRAINCKYLPYEKELCEITFQQLKTRTDLDKDTSQTLVDNILSRKELQDYTLIERDQYNYSKIYESLNNCDKKMYSQTIRKIETIEVAIIDYRKLKNNIFSPYAYQTIGLYKWSFFKWAKEILSSNEDVIFIAQSNKDSPFLDWDTLDSEGFTLKAINDPYLLNNRDKTVDVVFVDKSIFKYTGEVGLELGAGNVESPLKAYCRKGKLVRAYKKDTFVQHNKAMINCYKRRFESKSKLNSKLKFTFDQLNLLMGEKIDWDKLIKAMICLHDYGKLNFKWQEPMRELQRLKDNLEPNEVLAHSDFNEFEKRSGAKNKPAHAGVGALALVENAREIITCERFESLLNPISTAILRHHGVENETYPGFIIKDREYEQMQIMLDEINIKTSLIRSAREGRMTDFLPSNVDEFIVYLFFVRILRLSDQKATENFQEYI